MLKYKKHAEYIIQHVLNNQSHYLGNYPQRE